LRNALGFHSHLNLFLPSNIPNISIDLNFEGYRATFCHTRLTFGDHRGVLEGHSIHFAATPAST
jgi:hypothetical protein